LHLVGYILGNTEWLWCFLVYGQHSSHAYRRIARTLYYSLHGTGYETKRGLNPYSMSLNFIHRLQISFKRTLPRRWCLMQPLPPEKYYSCRICKSYICQTTLKNKSKSNGEQAAGSCSFSERGKLVAIFHVTANICGVKVSFCQNVKTEKKRKELFVPYC
jgi:hypothetical protein